MNEYENEEAYLDCIKAIVINEGINRQPLSPNGQMLGAPSNVLN